MTQITAFILIPVLAGSLAFLLRNRRLRGGLLLVASLAHLSLTASAWWRRPILDPEAWLGLDAAGLLFLSITSVLFVAAAFYALGFLQQERHENHKDVEEGFLFSNEPEAVFIGCMLYFLAAMTLVALSRHLGILWVAIEATTLTSAPLIYFHRHHRSLEATWKYLLVCSVGIALALLGNFFLGVAAANADPGGSAVSLLMNDLLEHASGLQTPWLKASFILLLVGYGTKMGLAPMHTWLPDAHSEAPSVVSALLSGAVLNCAFLGILRSFQVCIAAGQAAFAKDLLVALGLLSMAVAAVFILGQKDYKRLLAYSSVEHMGILALGIGLGGVGAFGASWHAINHSITKTMLFLVAGNILTVYRTKTINQVQGISRAIPWTGMLWISGFLAITGTPPFGTFFSEFTILKAAFDQHLMWIGIVYLGLLALIFITMSKAFIQTALGMPSEIAHPEHLSFPWLAQVPPLALALIVLGLGIYLPAGLRSVLEEVAILMGGAG